MGMKGKFQSTAAVAISAAMLLSMSSVGTMAVDKSNKLLNIQHTYSNNGYTFEKISHASEGTETADGVVDYLGNHNIEAYVDGVSETGNGDSTQSYSYCAATYGDWVYVGTMYGALSAYAQAKNALVSEGISAEIATAVVDAMFNGKLNKGREDDGYYAGSVFFKFNAVTGETQILMSREMYENDECEGVPIFRSAIEYNDKLYFVGLVSKGEALTQYGAMALDMEIMMQSGVPCIYELDPTTDELTEVYRCVDMEAYRALNAKNVFTSTRAIGTYQDYLIAGGLTIDVNNPSDMGQAVLYATNDPGSGDFKIIADMDDLFNYPAIWRNGSSGGGGIYQVVEYNGSLYVAIVSGTYETMNPETRQFQPFAVVRGDYDATKGAIDDANAWTWTSVIGDQENDGAKYTFGIDPERTSSSACTLQVYNDYLYIGEYNDVNGGLNGVLKYQEFATLANNLTQSINLYRMDSDENIEMVVGDATEMFPDGSISGWGSGYETHMTQYTWMTNVYDGVMYLSTMDETSLLHTFSQLVNGELFEMSEEEWESQINYIKVLLELILDSMDTTSTSSFNSYLTKGQTTTLVNNLVKNANGISALSSEQVDEIVDDMLDNNMFKNCRISKELIEKLEELNELLEDFSDLISSKDLESFVEAYKELLEEYFEIESEYEVPAILKSAYKMLLDYVTLENMADLMTCMSYMVDSVAGFDLYAIEEDDNGDVTITTVTNNGFNDRYNHGLRIFANTDDYMVIGTANPFFGTQLWRMSETPEAIFEHTHVAGEPVKENIVEPTADTDGSYDLVVYCTVCGAELNRETIIVPAVPESSEESRDPESSEESRDPESSEESRDPESSEESGTPESSEESRTPESSKTPTESSQNSGTDRPGTGDSSNWFIWVVIGTMAVGSFVLVVVKQRQKSNK